jgi:restriction system protein
VTARSRPRLRRPRGTGERVAASIVVLAAAVLAAQLAIAAWHALLRAWPALAAMVAIGILYGLWRASRSVRAKRVRAAMLARLRITLADIDAMGEKAFEFALRDLLIRDGWTARHVGRKGDQAADVIGDHPRRGRIVLQAKHTRVGGKVGCSVMYQVKGTAGPVHGADVAVVVTNSGFTRDARDWGERHQVHWTDRDRLRAWAEYGTPLHDLLRLPKRPSRRAWRARRVRPAPGTPGGRGGP